jgi:two-component system nitrogen regulation sensor histidine kinase NtrY
MDARTAESRLTSRAERWLQQERVSGRFYDRLTLLVGLFLLAMMGTSIWLLRRGAEPGELLSPPVIAFLLVANLIPAIALMALYSRRVAIRRAEGSGLGSARLHVRLVALFSAIAAIPTVLVAIFASVLFQTGLEFWASNRARNMLENTVEVARSAYKYELGRVADQASPMASDITSYLQRMQIDDPEFKTGLAYQTYQRSLNEAAILRIGPSGEVQTLGVAVGNYGIDINEKRIKAAIAKLEKLPDNASVDAETPNRIAVITRLNSASKVYLYVGRADAEIAAQIDRANDVLRDYQALLSKSRVNQLRFNAALLLGALIIVGLAIFTALKLADRMVRPVGELVSAAGRIEEGDFSARVPVGDADDEIQTLATAFNRMAGRLDEQTGALRTANTQLDARRAFMEAVLSSVTAGVIALDTGNRILLVNRSAETLLQKKQDEVESQDLRAVSSDLAEFMRGEQAEANVIVATDGVQRTLAVKRARYPDGSVLTFDDITDQLTDQRRAAWSDIAQRIAHEIRNPLTPIQLAAERMQRKFGAEITSDKETFERLSGTIIRQVGDLRRMVDEFSNFARMPKPAFRDENVYEIARQALFLHEVAHPGIIFELEPPQGQFRMVCDRRQLAQALTNVVKNGVEAIEGRKNRGEHSLAGDRVQLRLHEEDTHLVIDVLDTGVGLPEERGRLTEPYMTTRVRGTGLGLAIVKKIVEEHMGEIAFLDRPGGGTHVRIAFDTAKLAALASDEELRASEDNDDNQDEG